MSDWILCTDKLPTEADGEVLICMPDVSPYNRKQPYPDAKQNKRVMIGKYSQYSKRWYKGDMCAVGSADPIAWMPLPDPIP